MSDLNERVAIFKENMEKMALFVNGDASTEVVVASGTVPSLAKQAKYHSDTIAALAPNLQQYLRIDTEVTYNAAVQKQLRKNIGLDALDNTADADKPLSTAATQALADVVMVFDSVEFVDRRNKIDGYFGYDGAKLPIRNGADKLFSYLYHNSTAVRNWQLPDKDGTIALLEDIRVLTNAVAKMQAQINALTAG